MVNPETENVDGSVPMRNSRIQQGRGEDRSLTRLKYTAAQMLKQVPGPFKIRTSQFDSGFKAARAACLAQAISETSTDGGVVQRGW